MDKEEMERFLREHDWIVKMVIHRCFPSLEGNEDYLQEGRIAMWQSVSKWDKARGEFLPFAFSAIRNSISSIINRQKSEMLYLEYSTDITDDSMSVTGSEFCFVDIDGWLAHLTPKQRLVVGLRIAGYTNAEIGSALGCTESNIRRHLKSMRKSFNEYI